MHRLSAIRSHFFTHRLHAMVLEHHSISHMQYHAEKEDYIVMQRHNVVRDALRDLSALAWNQVKREPFVKEANSLDLTPALIADLPVRGV